MKRVVNRPKTRGQFILLAAIALTIFLNLAQPAFSYPRDRVVGNMMLINDNGGWCWYQDDKIVFDPVGDNVITSTAGHPSGFGGSSNSRVDTTTFNIDTGKRTQVVASTDAGDDHDMGALWVRPDGKYLHMYAPHYSANDETYFRLSTYANDGSAWGSEQSYDWRAIPGPTRPAETHNLSYTNVHYLSGEGTGNGRLYNIARVFERTTNLSYSDDWGNLGTWQYMGRLNGITGTTTYSNFYHKFRSNGVDRIDFIGCEQHPRNYTNSVYHGYIQNGKSYNSYGVEMDTINDVCAPSIQAYTPVWLTGPVAEGEYHTGWTNEIELDKDGFPVCLFQTRYGLDEYGGDPGAADHRFFYGRFDGSSWSITELGKMGTGLHTPEEDYIGMGCIHPNDANLIYISTPFDPRDDSPLAHHEIFKGVTYDKGATWNWTQITIDSTADNIRPAIPQWDPYNTAVFWTRGFYPGQENYDFAVVGMVIEEDMSLGLVSYIDASPSNTTESDGSAFTPTGPSGSPGSSDNQWHEYTGYGNGGSCYTAGDGGTENAPTIKTTITGLSDGLYDVFAYFWCDPNADWGIRGGFTSSDMLCFRKQSSQHAEAAQFSGSVTVLGSNIALYRVYIGRKEISGGGSIIVYLDNYDSSYSNAPTRTAYDGVGVASVSYVEDVNSPNPDPMTWASVPNATGPMAITMTATTATDDSPPVQYYFECTNDGSKSSDWQTNPTYVASGLNPSTQYYFKVKARDSSSNQNETDWSSTESATTDPPDTTPPTPDPMTWSSFPTATGSYTITMTATTATDAVSPPVEYYFECTNDGSKSSDWQSSTTYVAEGLTPSTQYSFKAKARDSYLTPNETGWSSTLSAITEPPPSNVELIGSWESGLTHAKEDGYSRALVFIAHGEMDGTMNLTGVTYGGQAMEKVVDRNFNYTIDAYVAAYILDDAGIEDATDGTFNPTWTTVPTEVKYTSVFLSNVNQIDPNGAEDTAGGTSTTISTSALATNNGDMVIDAATCGNLGTYTMTANGFTLGDHQSSASSTGATGYKSSAGGTEICSVTHNSVNRQALIGFVVQAQAGGGIPGDLNEDERVDFIDFAILGEEWLTTYDIDTLADIADYWLYGT